ncbi:MarR family winged helix-turn-helix transcriptional regulator [Alkaliphilus peptidifermentans]|uniref:DNA-binding transcriptional regulator, MarR family n=1 Tax=Alkaliphilus peptidifermentans DSM 18978 TaxID=1120976 RepID=A0A1G5KVG6_9FIRM|nr:MarR family transcriptional regulator [Alkaliphilus peptidifermentans]SCZ03929.1 DNA-binding transcriptional regulator, MarR family [Alkaliphilus peptidifermentans DSM 18978]
MNEEFNFESLIFEYLDQIKFLFFPDQWSSAFLDYSKNEVLVLIFLYRKKSANMTVISDYINAPLNTTTGVVGRLEKKQMVERKRNEEDRRIVNIVLTSKAYEFINLEKKVIEHIIKEVITVLTEEEKATAINIFNKILSLLKQEKQQLNDEDQPVKKVKRILIE